MNPMTARTVRAACIASLCGLALLWPFVAAADPFFFSTGDPDGKIGTLSRPSSPGKLQTETADDFVLSRSTQLDHATFTGLIPSGTPLGNITQVEIELYHVFPVDSANPPSVNVPTRVNSPADVEIASATRDGIGGTLTFSASLLNPSFSVLNTVVNGINKSPNQFTGGEGPAPAGEEVLIDVTLTTPIVLTAGHYFFRPEALVTDGDFLWLSAPKPIVAGTPFSPDLQSWIRNDDLAPDWLRIGTDITGQGPFNAAFSLAGQTVPAPSTLLLLGSGLAGLGALGWRRKRSGSR